jgi:hypothetical protein
MEHTDNPTTEKCRSSSSRQRRSVGSVSNDTPERKVKKAKTPSSSASKRSTVANKSSSIMDLVENARNKAKKTLASSDAHEDLEFTLKCVKGLIKVNQEIWGRCEDYCVSKDQGSSDIKMIGIRFDKVTFEEFSGVVLISTRPAPITSSFGGIPVLPKELEDIFPLSCSDGVFPNYEHYLKNVLLLENGVLEAFLPIFRSYLEGVQIFLGGIETWLNESMETRHFLMELFGKDVDLGSINLRNRYTPTTRFTNDRITLLRLDHRKTMNISFHISSERDRERLKAYLGFMKM